MRGQPETWCYWSLPFVTRLFILLFSSALSVPAVSVVYPTVERCGKRYVFNSFILRYMRINPQQSPTPWFAKAYGIAAPFIVLPVAIIHGEMTTVTFETKGDTRASRHRWPWLDGYVARWSLRGSNSRRQAKRGN